MPQQIQGFHLSPQQKRLWLLQQNSSVYLTNCAILIEGSLQVNILKAALQKVIDRNEILRTSFHKTKGIKIPIQVVENNVALSWHESTFLAANIENILQENNQQDIDWQKSSLLHTTLLKLSPEKHILLVNLPAMCADTASLNNLLAEISCCYSASLLGDELADEQLQYADISAWQNELLAAEETITSRKYWQQLDISQLENFKLSFEQQFSQSPEFQPQFVKLSIPSEFSNKIENIVKKYQCSTSVFFLACWLILLWRLTDESKPIIGLGCDGHNYEELKAAIGLLAKYLPLTCELTEKSRFSDILNKLSASTTELTEWQESFAWEQIAETNQDNTEQPFLPFCFDFEEAANQYDTAGILFSIYQKSACIDRFKIKLACTRTHNQTVNAEFHYDANLFSPADIQRLASQWQTLLISAVENPSATISQLNILSNTERQQILIDFNNTQTTELQYECIHHWFEQQCNSTPDNIAIVFQDQQLTYQELNTRANQLAHYLQKLGVGPDVLVGICVERSLWMVIGLLAILKAGAAYVPLDPAYPVERQTYIIADTNTPLVLTQQHLAASLPDIQLLYIDTEWSAIALEKTQNLVTQTTSQNLAYVIYTSGSTGKPKGTLITHQGLVNYLSWCTQAYNVEQGTGTLVHSPLGFDLTVTSLFSPLLVGRQVELVPENQGIDALSTTLRRSHNLSLVKITPAHLDLLKGQLSPEEVAGRTQAFIIGGENLLAEKLTFWQDFAPDTMLINEYGPTETVVGCCVYQVPNNQRDSGSIPIGKPIANTQLYVLDKYWQPVPIGVVGELYIAGLGLARGYLNRPELTAQKFIPNPFSNKAGERLYRTGDLARYRSDGTLEFLGRIDNQVKIRGFRIELGEIEAVLEQHPEVKEIVVIAREDAEREKRLVAYVVVNQKPGISISELRSYLLEKLPEYMIPAAFIKLDALPLTPNGKVDYRALPEQAQLDLEETYVAPQSELEQIITNIWQELLHIEKVGIHHNFFDIGGHSLLMVQVHSKLQKALNRDISMLDMFQYPTISKFAKYLNQEQEKKPDLPNYELSENQRESRKQRRQLRQEHRATSK
ncbi:MULTISPECIES: non-ribosomal peptide synthetase [unclassified Tolypothrix]|uniref:non-ribosomal peptide synthetase n=1 Tax=unclassified Tolypothrix TaxID=2649714 RepID=UPI0005EABE6B|nr:MULTISPECIES: non-ribosomal peptide synthetase [unclassified Tolypothrix]BAY91154.1 amino acid adenylation domain-containing protein [Microchaete diplosiphon NIES-3275]EKE99917.1 AMP-binding enzyme [Tolypothrix sp. PCC 7601]MBE9081405.1 non-ribosomal peptide synthetase [Tolypothrix sp. LEGE 11397]UYD25243.1 non-ribosomal peptide synthetase [Tolypothrix sp. PCC 7712]UYD32518.1 non-ribosomal peptide synthetase [Tolypothrix sp. PCC 7601]